MEKLNKKETVEKFEMIKVEGAKAKGGAKGKAKAGGAKTTAPKAKKGKKGKKGGEDEDMDSDGSL